MKRRKCPSHREKEMSLTEREGNIPHTEIRKCPSHRERNVLHMKRRKCPSQSQVRHEMCLYMLAVQLEMWKCPA